MTISIDRYYAAQADALQRKQDRLGHVYGDPSVTSLRCFQRYHKEATRDVVDPWGRTRWLSQKQSRIYAILDRDSSNGARVLKMKDIASEAMASISTVSRTVVKLQAFGLFAIDVTRGRHGGISVRKRHVGDHLRYYAEAAWKRIRSWINVASAPKEEERDLLTREKDLKKVTTSLLVDMDATFIEAWDEAEARGRLLADERAAEPAVAPLGRDRGFDPGALTAVNVVAERQWLDENDPDWDLELEKVRASLGFDSQWP